MMKILYKSLAILVTFTFFSVAFATPADDRYLQLTQQLRCLVCQNESLADSDAPLAKDLRQQIQTRIATGESNQQIIDYLTQRYGEFILFKPTTSGKNLPLWLGPFVILMLALTALSYAVYRHRRKSQRKLELSDEEKNKLEQLLK